MSHFPRFRDASFVQNTLEKIIELRKATEELEREFEDSLDRVAPSSLESARNLVHYLAIRRRDVRHLQNDLSCLGLSSLGRMEAHVQATLDAVATALSSLLGDRTEPPVTVPLDFDRGDSFLSENAERALGPPLSGEDSRIMVTIPTEAATTPDLVRQMLSRGMGVARINCAHDNEMVWQQMLENIARASNSEGRSCKISFDLAGPKLRTGPVAPFPAVRRFKPDRDIYGRVESPARIPLTLPEYAEQELVSGAPSLPVDRNFFEALRTGLGIKLSDTRGRNRTLRIESVIETVALARCDFTSYLAPGTEMHLVDPESDVPITGTVQEFEPAPSFLSLIPGQTLIVEKGNAPGRDAILDENGWETSPARISSDLEAIFRDSLPGQPIHFDDGKIEGVIRSVEEDQLVVEIVRSSRVPGKLRAEKGINLPETRLRIPGLTANDISHLDFIAAHGNLVSLSFVRSVADVEHLLDELDQRGARDLGIVLKIETREGFENLAALLLAAMRHPPVVVMIARGDLGVELGFERMAEVQEEILWLCEAAHVPVIWATQVLESLAKKGLATRGEVTDAAMSSRAECVMLNKGPHIVRAVETLHNILTRMSSHQFKKTATLRKLSVAGTSALS